MIQYPKIISLFKRDEKTHKFLEGNYKIPEFEYLKNNIWEYSEKLDGTNIRIEWQKEAQKVIFGGRTDNAQIPARLYEKLQELFPVEKFKEMETDICLFGEGIGAKIQKGGGNYIRDGMDFILFDVLIDRWWLERNNLVDIANKLEIKIVSIVFQGTLGEGVGLIKNGLKSQWGDFQAEGIVGKPFVELKNRNGNRILVKIKHKDFI